MNKKSIIIFIVSISIATIYVLWNNGTLNPGKVKISEDVYLVQNNSSDYSIFCRIGRRQELIANSVDSIILTPRYGTMLYGIGAGKTIKEWHYIDASSSKNIYGGWNDSIFRNESIVTIGRDFLKSVKTSNEIWDNKN